MTHPITLSPAQSGLATILPLSAGRAHEALGAGATAFAAVQCGLTSGPVIWITERWRNDGLNPVGLADFCDPARLLLVRPDTHIDLLASAEEALKSGAVPLVVAEISQALTLTAGRRLQLAAAAGNAISLFLISEGMGSNAAETRWDCQPLMDQEDSTLWRWSLKKNKKGTLTVWDVNWDASARRITVVSPALQRPGAAAAPA